MPAYDVIDSLVDMVVRGGTDTPEDYRDTDAATKRYIERKAGETGDTPENVWKVVRTQREESKVNMNDPASIAKAARRR